MKDYHNLRTIELKITYGRVQNQPEDNKVINCMSKPQDFHVDAVATSSFFKVKRLPKALSQMKIGSKSLKYSA